MRRRQPRGESMRQTLHLFKKDVLYLRYELCLMLALTVICTLSHQWWTQGLLLVAAMYLIERVVHAEPIPGENQFWITRPYGRSNLIGSKILFIVVFVNLPIFLIQALIVFSAGFEPRAVVAGLIWSQIYFLLLFSLPVAALASITRGILPFILSVIVVITATFSAWPYIIRSSGVWPTGLDWVRLSLRDALLAAVTLTILHLQYRN